MKKQLLLLLSVITAATSFGSDKEPRTTIKTRDVKLSGAFTKLVTRGAVTVVLFEDTIHLASIQGRSKNVDAVQITEDKGVLTVSTRMISDKAVVYLPVKDLEMIDANGYSRVFSTTILTTPLLTLVANDYCRIAVRSTGRILVHEVADSELFIEKNDTGMVTRTTP